MNYILHFQPKTPGKEITQSQIKEYFAHQGKYTVNDYQALYDNQDTGVFFTFEYGGRRTPEAGTDREILPVYFNLPAGKPHIFALEAETELAGFIETFELRISDPAMKGGGYRDYDEMEFYLGWTNINESYYRENHSATDLAGLPSLPLAYMEKCWKWNFHVAEKQGELGQTAFMPKVLLIEHQSAFFTAVVWTDAQPIILPRVDRLILYRRTVPRGLRLNKKEDIALIDFKEVEPLLQGYLRETEHLEFFNLLYQNPPETLKRLFQNQKAVSSDSLKFISFSQVHDRELINKINQQP